jgi:hypothetical protein
MQVLEVRNLAKQGVSDGEKMPDWEFYSEPYLLKCEMLLQVPPLCPNPKQNPGKRLLAAALAIKDTAKCSTSFAECNWDKIVSAVHARQVYKRYRYLC